MPFDRPTLSDLIARAKADLTARLPGTDARPRRSVLSVLASVHAGADHGQYGYLDWLSRQVLPDTAEAEHLERHASVWGLTRKPAQAASGNLTVSGAEGATIPAGTVWRRSDGALYAASDLAIITTGTATVAAAAQEPGQAGATEEGSPLWLVSPLAGIGSKAVVAAGGITGGEDQESDGLLLSRLLSRIQKPPHGGADFDYVAWAKQVPGVTRAYCYPQRLGAGTVGVTILMDGRADIIPTVDDLAEVQAAIDAARPVTAVVTVFALTAQPLNPNIHLRTNDTPEIRAAVEAEMNDLISREAEPEGTLLLSRIREAISRATGEHDHVLTSPTGDVTAATGKIITLGTITWS